MPGKLVLVIIALICAVMHVRERLRPHAATDARRHRSDGGQRLDLRRRLAGDRAAVPGEAERVGPSSYPTSPATSPAPAQAFGLTASVEPRSIPGAQPLSRRGAAGPGAGRRADPGARPQSALADVQRQAAGAELLRLQVDARHRSLPDSAARSQDVALAVRELTLSGLPSSRRPGPTPTSSTPTGTALSRRRPTPFTKGGLPDFIESDLPPTRARSRSRSRGSTTARCRRRTRSSGSRAGSTQDVEFDLPSSSGSRPAGRLHPHRWRRDPDRIVASTAWSTPEVPQPRACCSPARSTRPLSC